MENSDESGSGKQGQQVNYTQPATTRLTDQTYEEFVRYTEQEGVGKSEALRRLIRTGLDENLEEETSTETNSRSVDTPPHDILISTGLVFVGLILVGDPEPVVYALTVATLGAGILWRVMDK
jgi:hypothetical protein